MEEIRAHASIGRMAVHETALLPGNVGKILDDRSINVHTLTVGGGYVWAGFSIRPSLLIRMDPDSLEYEKIQIPDTGGLHCLCYDGRYCGYLIHQDTLLVLIPCTDHTRQ